MFFFSFPSFHSKIGMMASSHIRLPRTKGKEGKGGRSDTHAHARKGEQGQEDMGVFAHPLTIHPSIHPFFRFSHPLHSRRGPSRLFPILSFEGDDGSLPPQLSAETKKKTVPSLLLPLNCFISLFCFPFLHLLFLPHDRTVGWGWGRMGTGNQNSRGRRKKFLKDLVYEGRSELTWETVHQVQSGKPLFIPSSDGGFQNLSCCALSSMPGTDLGLV